MGSAASIGRELRADLSRTIGDVMALACESLRAATPKDTENAANNWIISVGAPFSGTDGSQTSPSHAAQDEGLDRIKSYDIGRDGKVYLRNNVVYLPNLDQGASPQAEAGFVARAFYSAVAAAPHGRKGAARQMLKGMARTAFKAGR